MSNPTSLDYHYSGDGFVFWDATQVRPRAPVLHCKEQGCDGELKAIREAQHRSAWSKSTVLYGKESNQRFLHARKLHCGLCKRSTLSNQPDVLTQLPEHHQRAYEYIVGDKPQGGLAMTPALVNTCMQYTMSSGSFNALADEGRAQRKRRTDTTRELYLLRQRHRVGRPSAGQQDIRNMLVDVAITVLPFEYVVAHNSYPSTATLIATARRHACYRAEAITAAMHVGAAQNMEHAGADHTYKITLHKTAGSMAEACLTVRSNNTGQPLLPWLVSTSSAREMSEALSFVQETKKGLSESSIQVVRDMVPCLLSDLTAMQRLTATYLRCHRLLKIADDGRISEPAPLADMMAVAARPLKTLYLDNCCNFRAALRGVLEPSLEAIPVEERLQHVNPYESLVSVASLQFRQFKSDIEFDKPATPLLPRPPTFLALDVS
jgi:hypothetical protein